VRSPMGTGSFVDRMPIPRPWKFLHVTMASAPETAVGDSIDGALPNLVVIGAMKCGTTSLHHYLDVHPDIAMSQAKELNFFFGDDADGESGDAEIRSWHNGNWHRGVEWYAAQFDAGAPVRGEASPGYTSPAHPEVAGRMAAIIPDARLLYAVRDPIGRAVSQFLHHRREGSETRDMETALLDEGSQYIARSRYWERLAPFVGSGALPSISIVAQEDLHRDQRATLRRLFTDLEVDCRFWSPAMSERRNASCERIPPLSPRLRDQLVEAVGDDAQALREFAGRDFQGWSA
jgi:hypothetical protein